MTGPFAVGASVLYRPVFAKRARRYTVAGYHADGRVRLEYSSPAARGGTYVTRFTFARPDEVREVTR